MSLYTTFKTYHDVLNFLGERDYPTCFKVNYLPNTDEYDLWIGNQPYESYEEIIEDVYNELNKMRDKNNKLRERNDYLDSILASYKTENKALKNRLHFEAGYNEKLEEEIKKLKGE